MYSTQNMHFYVIDSITKLLIKNSTDAAKTTVSNTVCTKNKLICIPSSKTQLFHTSITMYNAYQRFSNKYTFWHADTQSQLCLQ